MSELYLYDDAVARAFEPFALTRPVSELRAGALLLRERWERATGMRAAGVVSSQALVDFEEPWSVEVAHGVLRAGSVVANSRCAVALYPVVAGDVWRCDNRVSAVVLPRDVDADELRDGTMSLEQLAPPSGRSVEIRGRWVDHVWDLIAQLAPMLTEDIAVLGVGAARTGAALGMVGGSHEVFAEDGATVEPQVFFDTSAGPVLVRHGATVQAFTRIVGPCVIGTESLVGGDKISGSSIGDVCKVHGEVSATIFLGHSNKGHDGYVGHSYLGRWVNLGAGTITSNLKNTYSPVEFWTPEGERDTGLQFLGTFFGDHTKTGIGTVLNTGTAIGAGANIFGGAMPPKVIPPFAWGDHPPYSTYRLDKFLEVARRVMARRHVELSARQVRLLTAAFERRWSVDTK
jgi:UDP-N-acetylglucosamine diphosphorylase/glucosamine-1-phosphate N-acetyltransferase